MAITPRQVVVNRDHVHTVTGQCIEVGGQRCYQCLALTGTHFSDLALVQHQATNQLGIEMAHAKRPSRCLAYRRKSFWQQLIQGLSVAVTLPEFPGTRRQCCVVQ